MGLGFGGGDVYRVHVVLPREETSGLDWNCNYGFDLGTGCMTELEQADLSDVEDLGRSFGTTSDECAASTTVAPSPTVGTPTSGTGWLGVTSIVSMLAALFVMVMLLLL
jgi:hypothetical protein